MDKESRNPTEHRRMPVTSVASGVGKEVLTDLYCLTIQIVNLCFVGDRNEWVLVDAGMPESANRIIEEAEDRFGPDCPPHCIILTHGHFDHVGAVEDLIDHWKVPVYAHKLEHPYLTGQKGYPKPDPGVEGGMLAKLSFMYPTEPIDISGNLHALPEDGSIPGMHGWRWIHTPGHSPGHVSLYRDEDRALIAGDAFITVRQDSLYKVMIQKQEVNGPPRYLTTDWRAAKHSVSKLLELKPEAAITGHGVPMSGQLLKDGLNELARTFDEKAVPDYGRYV